LAVRFSAFQNGSKRQPAKMEAATRLPKWQQKATFQNGSSNPPSKMAAEGEAATAKNQTHPTLMYCFCFLYKCA